jgi:L-serine dehydratase
MRVILDPEGSLAGIFGLMAEDRGMVAGVLGILPDDVRIFKAHELARQAGMTTSFEFAAMKESTHINACKFVLTGQSGRVATLVGDSTGGGMIETRWVDGYPLRLKGDTFVLLAFDPESAVTPSMIALAEARLPSLVASSVSCADGKGSLYVFKLADPPDLVGMQAVFSGLVLRLLQPVLPVVTRPGRKSQLFDTMTRWREIADERGLALWEVAVQYEIDASGWERQAVLDYMRLVASKMRRQCRAVYEEDVVVPRDPFKVDYTSAWAVHQQSTRRLTDDITANTIKWAYGASAGIPGVEIVPGPMGTGGGYIYAALSAVQQAHGFSEEDLLRGLFIAAGVGAIAYSRTAPTGEVIGCTGECGVCGAMAAAAIAEMAGGSPQQVEAAASLSLQSTIGIPCDPIPGGVGQPCRSRVLAAACMAHVFADVALAGQEAVLPLHEVLDVADAVGRRLPPELLCTSRGGTAVAPTAQQRAAAYRDWCRKE